MDAGTFHPSRAVASLWMPLISHVESLHAGFITTLVTQLTLQSLNEPAGPSPGSGSARDSSYDSFIAAWAIYLLDTQALSTGGEDANRGVMTKANIILIAVGGLGPQELSTLSERKT